MKEKEGAKPQTQDNPLQMLNRYLHRNLESTWNKPNVNGSLPWEGGLWVIFYFLLNISVSIEEKSRS